MSLQVSMLPECLRMLWKQNDGQGSTKMADPGKIYSFVTASEAGLRDANFTGDRSFTGEAHRANSGHTALFITKYHNIHDGNELIQHKYDLHFVWSRPFPWFPLLPHPNSLWQTSSFSGNKARIGMLRATAEIHSLLSLPTLSQLLSELEGGRGSGERMSNMMHL